MTGRVGSEQACVEATSVRVDFGLNSRATDFNLLRMSCAANEVLANMSCPQEGDSITVYMYTPLKQPNHLKTKEGLYIHGLLHGSLRNPWPGRSGTRGASLARRRPHRSPAPEHLLLPVLPVFTTGPGGGGGPGALLTIRNGPFGRDAFFGLPTGSQQGVGRFTVSFYSDPHFHVMCSSECID